MILSILRCPSFTSDYVTVHWPNSGSQNEPSNEFAKFKMDNLDLQGALITCVTKTVGNTFDLGFSSERKHWGATISYLHSTECNMLSHIAF